MPMISVLKTEKELAAGAKGGEMLVRRLLLPFGGGEFFFCPGEKTVFLVDAALPADNETGVNFDLRLLFSVLRLAIDEGVTDISVCFKPAEGFDGTQVLERTGYGKLTALPHVKLIDLSEAPVCVKTTDTGLVLEEVDIYQVLAQADVVISLAKFKAAEGRLFGGALANAALAAQLDNNMEQQMKDRAGVDVYSIMAPDLTIVDCIIGQSGFQNNKNSCVLAGSDGVALDTVLCAVGDLDIYSHESLLLTGQYGMGVSDPGQITIFGDDLREVMAGTDGEKNSTEPLLS